LKDRESRIVITGIGAIMPGGIGMEEIWNACLQGNSGIDEISFFDTSSFPVGVAGEVPDDGFLPLVPEEKWDKVDRFSALAIAAGKEVLGDSDLDISAMRDKIGVYMGSCYSGRKCVDKYNAAMYRGGIKRVHPRLMQNNLANACSGEIAIQFGLTGANLAYSVGSSSGSYALIQAFNALKLNSLEAILVGGAEAPILPLVLEELNDLGEMSGKRDDPKTIVRPFDQGRSGFVLSEGSCILIFERLESALSRGAHIYAELIGYSVQYDRNRRTENGFRTKQMASTMEKALKESSLAPERVCYINASGMSTTMDDIAETRAIKDVFGDIANQIPVSSIKPITGYAISASEALEVAICALSIHRGVIPPTMNLHSPEEECDLDYVPHDPREIKIDAAMSNSFGIDGNYSSIVLEKFKE
jgi:3-oxoacyl-[acyl-carrier-protein] synthase II